MSSCPNCGAKLSCGCQKRTLPNGKQGCSNCANKAQKTAATPTKVENTFLNNRESSTRKYLNLKKFIK
jgi:hypothetical protein